MLSNHEIPQSSNSIRNPRQSLRIRSSPVDTRNTENRFPHTEMQHARRSDPLQAIPHLSVSILPDARIDAPPHARIVFFGLSVRGGQAGGDTS